MSPTEIIERLRLEPLEGEGGLWSPIYRDDESNAIYFMMIAPDFSAWHRINEPELWIHIDGEPIILSTIEEGKVKIIELDRSVGSISYRVPAGIWMAARPKSDWSLAICALTPPFSGMELARREQLEAAFPEISELPGLFHE